MYGLIALGFVLIYKATETVNVAQGELMTALQKTGANLSTDALAKALKSLKIPSDIFGMPAISWSPTSYPATSEARLSQLRSGRWQVVLDYDQMRK